MGYYGYGPYVSVAKRQQIAERQMTQLQKQGATILPVQIDGRKIAKTFWGEAWCDHIEMFSDRHNRLPRGRTYVRNGSVCHLAIEEKTIDAKVAGSEVYSVAINIDPLPNKKWQAIKKKCAGKIATLLELLGGQFSDEVMSVVCDYKNGLFPAPSEIALGCNCPDGAYMCKHIAAVLYGVGSRLDHEPAQLFALRGVDHQELIDMNDAILDVTSKPGSKRKRIADSALTDVFGIDLVADKASEDVVAKKDKTSKAKTSKDKQNKEKQSKNVQSKAKQQSQKKKIKSKQKPAIKSKKSAREKLPKFFTGASIYKKRKELGLTQADFSKRLGVSSATVSKWENMGRKRLQLQPKSETVLQKFWLKYPN